MAIELAIDRTATPSAGLCICVATQWRRPSDRPAEDPQASGRIAQREWTRLGISTTIDLQPTPTVLAQEGQLQLAFLHLLINAEEAAVRIPASLEYRCTLPTTNFNARSALRLRTTAPALPARHRDQVFKPFYTTKAAGTGAGLGLTTVRNIVERHRGRVLV